MKHLRTEVEGSRKRRVYDAPATPFERLKACEALDKEQIAALDNLYHTLDPLALKVGSFGDFRGIFAGL
ncbi:MAG TPA: hypothetical protein VIS96_19335 [Terrimicrobiaceae bacterium]